MEKTITLAKPFMLRKNSGIRQDKLTLQNSVLWNLSLITAGSILCAWAINGILIPQQFLSGGLSGLALIIHYLFPSLSVGSLYFLLNIPIYVLGWMYVGRRFFCYSIAGMLIFSAAIMLVTPACPIQDKMLSALLAGILCGAGGGIILRSLGSAGGTDILSIILLKRFSIRLGTTVLFFNISILFASMFLFSPEAVLYTLISMYVSSRIIDLMVTGLSKRKAVFIISRHWEKISQTIKSQMNRGVTLIRGEGGYSGQEGNILYTVIAIHELPQLKEVIRQTDSAPFVVISDTLEVIGQRIGNQPHW